MIVIDVVDYKKNVLGWTFGTYSWFTLVALCAIFASYATIRNQKRLKLLNSENELKKKTGKIADKVSTPQPTIWE